jgi:hypothetical protein
VGLNVKTALGDLLRSPRFQIRKTDPHTVRRYAHALRAGAEFPPIKVANIAGALVLVDGYHRAAAHELIGSAFIEAEIIVASGPEALWLAAEANLRHGKPLKRAEVRKAFAAFINARRYKVAGKGNRPARLLSLREISREFGGIVPHTTVRNWLIKDHPKVARLYGGEAAPWSNAEPPAPEPPEVIFTREAEAALRVAVTAARGVQDPERRGQIIAATEGALREIREAARWKPLEPFEF